MKVNGKDLTTIWYDENEDHVNIIDQTLLPYKYYSLNDQNYAEIISYFHQTDV